MDELSSKWLLKNPHSFFLFAIMAPNCALNPLIFTFRDTPLLWLDNTVLPSFSFYFSVHFFCFPFMGIISSTCSLKYQCSTEFCLQPTMPHAHGFRYNLHNSNSQIPKPDPLLRASDISIWMSHRYLKLHMSKIELNILSKSFSSDFLHISGITAHLTTCAKNNYFSLFYFFPPLVHLVLILLVFIPLIQVQLISSLNYCIGTLNWSLVLTLISLEIHSSEWQK